MKTDAYIAVAWGSPGGATAEISNAIEELVGKRPKPIRLFDLAGPNETVQVLLSIDDWVHIAKAVALIYGAELVKEAAKSTWKAATPVLGQVKDSLSSLFGNLVSGISSAVHAKAPVILGLSRTPVGGRRHIGVEISNKSAEEIGRIVVLLAKNGEEIERKLNEWDKLQANRKSIVYEENSDCSVKLIVTDSGAIQLRATISDDSFTTREEILYELVKQP